MIVVAGAGLVSAAGEGVDALARALADGRTRAAALPEAVSAGLTRTTGYRVALPLGDAARVAAHEALDAAALAPGTRLGLVLATALGTGSASPPLPALAAELASHLGADGPRAVHSATCASALYGLDHAALDLAHGRADAVLLLALDALDRRMQGGFAALGALAADLAGPPTDALPDDGILLGEAAAALVLRPGGHGSRILGRGLAADGTHLTSPDTSGAGMARAIRAALDDAGLRASDIGELAWTAAGSPTYRALYQAALARVWGDAPPPVGTWEVAIGHALAATGALGPIHAALRFAGGLEAPLMSLTVGFGGQNGATVIAPA